jgi:hypothetical protein
MIDLFGFSVNEIYLILGLELGGGIIFILGWFLYNKDKFTALICEKYLNTYKIKKKMKVSMQQINFKWGVFSYAVDFNRCIIDNKSKPVIYYLYHGAKPILPLAGLDIKEDSQTFKIVTDGRIMQHLGSRRSDKLFTYIIIGCIVVIGIISAFSIYQSGQQAKEIMVLTRQLMNVTKASLEHGGVIIP